MPYYIGERIFFRNQLRAKTQLSAEPNSFSRPLLPLTVSAFPSMAIARDSMPRVPLRQSPSNACPCMHGGKNSIRGCPSMMMQALTQNNKDVNSFLFFKHAYIPFLYTHYYIYFFLFEGFYIWLGFSKSPATHI